MAVIRAKVSSGWLSAAYRTMRDDPLPDGKTTDDPKKMKSRLLRSVMTECQLRQWARALKKIRR